MLPRRTTKPLRLRVFLRVLAGALLVASGCEQNTITQEPETSATTNGPRESVVIQPPEPTGEPLLLLDEEPLLLLEDDETGESAEVSGADNSRCFVCHANYLDEKIAVTHAQAGIGCATCHGDSDAHIADESWGSGGNGTAPDSMFPRETIIPACMKCHPKDKIDTADHEPVFAQSIERKVCTDCHGDHRLAVRRCKWK